MSSTRGRVKRIAQRTREWVSQTAPTPDSDSDIPSLASSDEEDSDIEIERHIRCQIGIFDANLFSSQSCG